MEYMVKPGKLKLYKQLLAICQRIYPDARLCKTGKATLLKIEYTCPEHGPQWDSCSAGSGGPAKAIERLKDRNHWCRNCHTRQIVTKDPSDFLADAKALILRRHKKGLGPIVKCLGRKSADSLTKFQCPVHGVFSKRWSSYRDNQSWTCTKCSTDHRATGGWLDSSSFDARLKESSYSLVEGSSYTGTWNPVKLRCPKHKRRFSVVPNTWVAQLGGFGCSECRREVSRRYGPVLSLEQVNAKLRKKKLKCLDYLGSVKSCKLKCLGCNRVWIAGQAWPYVEGETGCGNCSYGRSRGEKALYEFVKTLASDAVHTYRIPTDAQDKRKHSQLDIYVPSKKLAIEFNGTYWHSTGPCITFGASTSKVRTRHERKTDICEATGIRLIHVWEHDWESKRSVIESLLTNALGMSSRRVYARKTTIKLVSNKEKIRKFYDKYHIQGHPTGGITLGVVYEGKYVAMMTFSSIVSERGTKKVKDEYELVRFASSASVIGGASKLLGHFKSAYSPKRIVSYSDRQYFTGDLYSTLGFKEVHRIAADYKVIWPGQGVLHKSSTTRKNLEKKFGSQFNPEKSEFQNSLSLGLHRVYDAGKIKWEWRHS